MIVLCSVNDRAHYLGAVYATTMQPIGTLPRLLFLAPTKQLVWGVKYKGWSDEEYNDGYRRLLTSRWRAEVKPWLDGLTPEQDVTLLCFCHPARPQDYGVDGVEGSYPTFCHRHLLARMLAKHRPDLALDVR